MTEKPIIFNTEMVKAILSGCKVCTRRLLKEQPRKEFNKFDGFTTSDKIPRACFDNNNQEWMISEPMLYQKDDLLYVRETWKYGTCSGYTPTNGEDVFKVDITYKAKVKNNNSTKTFRVDEMCFGGNLTKDRGVPWKPSIHMPKKYARLFLKVTNVRVERLNDISGQDSVKEGLYVSGGLYRGAVKKNGCKGGYSNPVNAFKSIWNSIYNNWNSNPWVWVIDFEVVKI